ncbi:CheR family methyltransferase [Candidatus Formimonas warabiya]|nr:protein-glutamate O-methyltransferase CheR [Candidatus Formimonas warabiya]
MIKTLDKNSFGCENKSESSFSSSGKGDPMAYHAFTQRLKTSVGIDLGGYKTTQMQRRIEHFIERCKCSGHEQFLQLLKQNTAVKDQFIKYLTINVTEFLRNPDLFRYLETNILPGMVQKTGTVKIWSAACSNGAEPYSMSIIMQSSFPSKPFHIDATDIDDEMLQKAKAGEYMGDVLKNLSPQRLATYFEPNGPGVRIKKSVSAHVSFRKHNLLLDVYDKGYDLIVCRNVTIYFTPEAQEYCYQGFSKSLNSGGVLFIGASENIFNYRKYGLERICPSFFRKI